MISPRSNTRPHVHYSPLPTEASTSSHTRGPSLRLTRNRSYHDDVDDDEEHLEAAEMGNEDFVHDEASPVDKRTAGSLEAAHAVEDTTLSVADRKVAIIAAALEETGMGRYQWCMCAFLPLSQRYALLTLTSRFVTDSSCVVMGTCLI